MCRELRSTLRAAARAPCPHTRLQPITPNRTGDSLVGYAGAGANDFVEPATDGAADLAVLVDAVDLAVVDAALDLMLISLTEPPIASSSDSTSCNALLSSFLRFDSISCRRQEGGGGREHDDVPGMLGGGE